MDTKLSRPAEDDDECRTKAAAWAWYQHGKGGSTGGASRALGAASVRAPAPSRFKAEAMKEQQQLRAQHAVTHHQPKPSPCEDNWDCGSSLFDSYELLSLSKQLDHAFTKAATTTLENATDLESPKRHTKLGKMLNQVRPKLPRPLGHSEVLSQQQHQLVRRVPDAQDHRSQDLHNDAYYASQEHDDFGCYHAALGLREHNNNAYPTSLFKNCDQPQYVAVVTAQGKPWSFRKLSRALLMLTPRPTSVSHNGDDFYSHDFHHQHHHLHHHHHQHEYHHQHEVHHHHHVHHIIHASPKMGYEAASQPPKLGTDY